MIRLSLAICTRAESSSRKRCVLSAPELGHTVYGLCHLHSSLSAGARRSSALHRRVSHRWFAWTKQWSLFFCATWRSNQTDARAPASSAPDARQQPSSRPHGMHGRRCACVGPCRGPRARPIAAGTAAGLHVAPCRGRRLGDAGQFIVLDARRDDRAGAAGGRWRGVRPIAGAEAARAQCCAM